jgi:oxygen-dependent protoporphyrinogen oxidase
MIQERGNMRANESQSADIKPVAIIGGGITGLTVAHRLKEKGIPVAVYESNERLGGVIRTVQSRGYLAECGPNTILETSPEVGELVSSLGLEGSRSYTDPAAKHRYVVRDKQLINMPSSPLGFLATELFSPAAKLRLLAEPFIGRALEAREESVSQFVVRRLGHEFLDHAIDALISGVYAGDPDKLSMQQAFPKLNKLEKRYGSLIKGQVFGARADQQPGEAARPDLPKFSFDNGLQVLTDALYAKVRDEVQLNSPVTQVAQTEQGWRLTTQVGTQKFEHDHSAVLYAGTAFRLPQIQFSTRRYINWSSFSEIYYPPVASVVLGFRREDVAHPLDGFGMIIPRLEGLNILGTIFSSSLFPNRAPTGHVTLTSYLGGARCPELAMRSQEELFQLARVDLGALLGAAGTPTFQHCTIIPKAIPQYDIGFGRFRTMMTEVETKAPGLFLAGHYRDGISIADSIVSASATSDRIARFLGPGSDQAPASGHLASKAA